MHPIGPEQVRAARSYLGWTQKQLADVSKVGLSAISEFEDGSSPRRETIEKLRVAFEKHGVEFTSDGGIKPRNDRYRIISGPDSCEKFFTDIIETTKREGGEIYAFLESYGMLTRAHGSGARRYSMLDRLSFAHQVTPIRCIVTEPLKASAPMPPFKLRTTPRNQRPGIFSFFIYGDKYALVTENQRMEIDFIIIRNYAAADEGREDFMSVWVG